MSQKMQASELVLAPDNSLYHIHLTGDNLADTVFLVGDPERVDMFKAIFDSVTFESHNRELHALTGSYHGQRFTALSTGMGCDNIDIVMTELDAAANIDLDKRLCKASHRTLNLIRIGTSGSLIDSVATGSLVASRYAIGLDGLLNYYQHDTALHEQELEQLFIAHAQLPTDLARPYAFCSSVELLQKVASDMHHAITVTAPGFYAPQGRHIRIAPRVADLNERLASFSWNNTPITNLEMETSAIYGMSRVMGHQALTVCLIIANRANGTFLNDYHLAMRDTIATIIERCTQ